MLKLACLKDVQPKNFINIDPELFQFCQKVGLFRPVSREYCIRCRRSVAPGSGRFKDRIPIIIDNEYYFICAQCAAAERKKVEEMEETFKHSQYCRECGRSVEPGSGRFVNRIHVFDDETGREFICPECAEKLGL